MVDAVNQGINMLRTRPQNRRRIILLISETRDRGSEGRRRDVLIAAQLIWPELNFDTPWLTYGRLRPLHTNAVKLYGCLCMNIDVIREQVELPPLEVNDKLVLHPVGAYNLTQSMQFIGLRPAVVLIGLDGSVNVIRRREKLIDIENAEQVPTYLQLKATQNCRNPHTLAREQRAQ